MAASDHLNSYQFSTYRDEHEDSYEAHDAGGKNVAYVSVARTDQGPWVDEVYVHPDHRGKGIADHLMTNAIAEHGHQEMRLKADPYEKEGKPTHTKADLERKYGKHGFQPTETLGHMSRPAGGK